MMEYLLVVYVLFQVWWALYYLKSKRLKLINEDFRIDPGWDNLIVHWEGK